MAIFGIAGACRRQELHYIQVDIREARSTLIIKIKASKNRTSRTFVVTNDAADVTGTPNFVSLYKKYRNLRPYAVHHRKLFIQYNKGKCTSQPVGINQFGKIPYKIAKFLSLPNPNLYTGHCFRKFFKEKDKNI